MSVKWGRPKSKVFWERSGLMNRNKEVVFAFPSVLPKGVACFPCEALLCSLAAKRQTSGYVAR